LGVRYLFLLSCLLAAVNPARFVLTTFRARANVKTITQFGPLPEVPVTWVDWLLGIGALTLLVAAAMELGRFRIAAPLALLATLAVWLHVGPGLWAHLSGAGYFEVAGHQTSIPWQQAVYQIAATVFAAVMTYRRYWRHDAV
jgi:hypothetical protein